MSFTSDVDLEAIIAEADAEVEARPDEPSLPPGEWMRKNLFSTPFNSVLTLVFLAFSVLIYRGFLNFVFSENTRWDAVRVNLRLLFTQAYPDENYTRIWVALGIVFGLTGLSIGLMRTGRGVSIKKIATWFISVGGLLAVGILVREPSVLKDAEGAPLLDSDFQVIRESFGAAMGDRSGWWLITAICLIVGFGLWIGMGDFRRRNTFVPTVPLTLGALGLLVSTTWWYNWGNYTFSDAGFNFEPGVKVAVSTRNPWTILWVLLVATYLIGRAARSTSRAGNVRALTNLSWMLAPFITYWAVLRSPVLEWDQVLATHLPLWLIFGVGGAVFLWVLTSQGIGELGRILAVVVLAAAAFTWVGAFFGWFSMLQKVRLSLLLLGLAALLAPNFKGEARQRLNLVYGWLGFATIFHVLVTLMNTDSHIEVPTEDFAGGFMITIYVAIFTMIFSFPLGVLLALARTSRLPLFRMMSTVYIESIRGVPLITILFFFTVFVNLFLPEGMELSTLAAVTIGFVLFSAAYLAENVRGGLQAIRRGQYEASDALGLTTVQRTIFIVLPQGLRVSIPPLVGQVIATFKETSLLAIVGIFDFLRIARDVIPNQTEFLGVRKEGLLFISVIYFIGAYAMSKYSQRLEKQLGVGER